MSLRHNEDISTSRIWKDFSTTTTPPLGAAIPLYEIEGSHGRPCKAVTMLQSGQLHVLDADGVDRSCLTTIPAGVTLVIEVGTIKAEQTASIFVQW